MNSKLEATFTEFSSFSRLTLKRLKVILINVFIRLLYIYPRYDIIHTEDPTESGQRYIRFTSNDGENGKCIVIFCSHNKKLNLCLLFSMNTL